MFFEEVVWKICENKVDAIFVASCNGQVSVVADWIWQNTNNCRDSNERAGLEYMGNRSGQPWAIITYSAHCSTEPQTFTLVSYNFLISSVVAVLITCLEAAPLEVAPRAHACPPFPSPGSQRPITYTRRTILNLFQPASINSYLCGQSEIFEILVRPLAHEEGFSQLEHFPGDKFAEQRSS